MTWLSPLETCILSPLPEGYVSTFPKLLMEAWISQEIAAKLAKWKYLGLDLVPSAQ